MLECMAALGQPGAAFVLPGAAGKCGSLIMYLYIKGRSRGERPERENQKNFKKVLKMC